MMIKMKTAGLIMFGVLALTLSGMDEAQTAHKATHKGFSNMSVKGCYSFEFHGTVIEQGQGIPMAAAGRMCGDGAGNVTELQRTLNVGNMVHDETAVGTYHVEPTGNGEAWFDVSRNGVVVSQEHYHAVVSDRGHVVDFVSRGVMGPNGEDISIHAIVSGQAMKQ
jgi:hypothetical protein